MLLLSDRRGGANNEMGKDMNETNQRRNPKGQKTFEKCSAYWC